MNGDWENLEVGEIKFCALNCIVLLPGLPVLFEKRLGESKLLSLSFKLIPCVRQSPEGRLDDKEFECMPLEDKLDFFGEGANIFGLFREFI